MCGRARIKGSRQHLTPNIKDMAVRMLIHLADSFMIPREAKGHMGVVDQDMEAVDQAMVLLIMEVHHMEATNKLISPVRTDGEPNKLPSTNL